MKIRIYDEEKRELVSKLIGEGTLPPGHRSRVYCVKHTKEDPNLLLSGGWDYRFKKKEKKKKKLLQNMILFKKYIIIIF